MTKTKNIELRGITWCHTRGFTPMTATAQRFEELNPNVRISWDKRSLQAFADEPIDELAKRYDLLVIDHPWAGFAAKTGVIVPLNEWLSAEFLADLAKNSVGKSHESYGYQGKQAIYNGSSANTNLPNLTINNTIDIVTRFKTTQTG